jgi:lipopolysaccharide biosynthesis glycosyltransferase
MFEFAKPAMTERLPIFFSFDEGYVTPAAVTFESLLSSARPGVFYELYVLHEGITTESQRRLFALADGHGNAALTFISVAGVIDSAGVVFDDRAFCVGHDKGKFTKETLLRCLPTLVREFQQYDRILYSDVDVCVVDDISDLFKTELEGVYLAGCRIPAFLNAQIGHIPEKIRATYVAGGIWLMNLKMLRQDAMEEKILGLMRNPPCRLIWNDQDVMNLACEGKTAFLSYRYCAIPNWRPILEKVDYVDLHYPNQELREALFRPKIIHFAYVKPWSGYCEGDETWHFWHRRTGFPDVAGQLPRVSGATAYFMKYLKLPRVFVSIAVRDGGIVIKILGFVLRIHLRRLG